jgi:hypothetical protein
LQAHGSDRLNDSVAEGQAKCILPACPPVKVSRWDEDPWVEAGKAFVEPAKEEYDGMEHGSRDCMKNESKRNLKVSCWKRSKEALFLYLSFIPACVVHVTVELRLRSQAKQCEESGQAMQDFRQAYYRYLSCPNNG